MTVLNCLLLLAPLTFQQPPQNPAQPPQPQAGPAAPVESAHAKGEMRVEISAILEGRYRYFDAASERKPEMRIQFRVAGDKIGNVVRYGNLILEEALDETGKSLVDASQITPEMRAQTRTSTLPADRLRETGLLLVARADASERKAQKLSKLRGTVKIVVADKHEEVMIINPSQYSGSQLASDRLREMGVSAEVVAPDQLEKPYQPNRSIALRFSDDNRIRKVEFFDGWMRNVRSRAANVKDKEGRPCMLYSVLGGELGDDAQLVLHVFPKIEAMDLPFELKDVALP